MTLDELTLVAWSIYDAANNAERSPIRAVVLAVLKAVERECVPTEVEVQTRGISDRADAWNDCRNQMLDKLAEMRK